MSRPRLRFGFSPCPNDTFAFNALAHGLIDAPFDVEVVLDDIEQLNRRAAQGELELSKISVGAYAGVSDRYRILRSGGALGHGCGPLVVARTPMTLEQAVAGRVAIPGRQTTAFRLLGLTAPDCGEVVEVRYDGILAAVEEGRVDAGLIIHESRFTYTEHDLVLIADLGEHWEQATGLPVPLAFIGARRDLRPSLARAAEAAIRASVEHAFADPAASRAYVREHAQEMSDTVCDAHIALYVNELSRDLGKEGLLAIERLSGVRSTTIGRSVAGVSADPR